jgi:SAM-dependent methyltransferase
MRAKLVARAGLDRWKRRSPTTYWRTRNAAALTRWMWIRFQRRCGLRPQVYDETFWDGHETGDWNAVAELLLRLLAPRSVADVGCGHGLLLDALAARSPGGEFIGIDDSDAAVIRARGRGLTVLPVDIAGSSTGDIEELCKTLGDRDLTICLEVAEHLPAWHTAKLLRVLTIAPAVFFSAAQPNQGGVLHVNEQPASHWEARFRTLGYRLGARDAALRNALQTIDVPSWYKHNARLFERQGLDGGQ